ncbi:hypothetical protein FQN54_001367 [Arachnomyces sp. PD_36]|nr:hypothetical protein FQN54_001367 [Arachnomyces sp. PD_36]
MSQNNNTTLSLPTRLLCYIGPPSTILLTSLASPKTALLTPLTFLTPAFFYKKWRESNTSQPSRHGGLEPMIWTFTAAGTLGLSAVAAVQWGICRGASFLVFAGEGGGGLREEYWEEVWRGTVEGLAPEVLARRAEMVGMWQHWVFMGVFTFIAAGVMEESLKFLPVVYARRKGTVETRKRRTRAYLDYILAGALSFGLVESVAFLYACEEGNESWGGLALTAFERVVLGQLGHLSIAALTALRAIRSDYGGSKDRMRWWEVIAPSAVLHGASNFMALAASSAEGNVGWIHPTGVWNVVGLLGGMLGMHSIAAWQVWKEWKELKRREGNDKSEEDEGAGK